MSVWGGGRGVGGGGMGGGGIGWDRGEREEYDGLGGRGGGGIGWIGGRAWESVTSTHHPHPSIPPSPLSLPTPLSHISKAPLPPTPLPLPPYTHIHP